MKRKLEAGNGDDDQGFLAASQLTSLRFEYKRIKRELAAALQALQTYQKQVLEMETFVSLVQRAWSQLDTDMGCILQAFLKDDIAHVHQCDELLSTFLTYGSSSLLKNPIIPLTDAMSFDIDKWSSPDDIEIERQRILDEVHTSSNNPVYDRLQNDLMHHSTFTRDILERLCRVVRNPHDDQQNKYFLRAIDISSYQSERLLLMDTVTKLKTELINLQAKYWSRSYQLERLERLVDKHDLQLHPPAPETIKHEDTVSSPTAQEANQNSSAVDVSTIQILERQLRESEVAKSKMERVLSDNVISMAPKNDSKEEISRLHQIIDGIRVAYKQKLTSYFTEEISLRERINDLEIALSQVEQDAKLQISEIMGATESELRVVRDEKAKAVSLLASTESEVQVLREAKTQMLELRVLEERARVNVAKLHVQLKEAQEHRGHLEAALEASRSREAVMEVKLERGIEQDGGELLAQTRGRADECQAALSDAQVNIRDLISEIESVAASEERSREQSLRLLRQMEDQQTAQKSTVEENLRLLEQISVLQQRHSRLKTTSEATGELLLRQESIISAFRQSEEELVCELNALRARFGSKSSQVVLLTESVREQTARVGVLEGQAIADKILIDGLKERCSALTDKLEEERRLRLSSERELHIGPVPKSNGSVPLKTEEASMLDMTLSMLRCSICKDRFKNVALTRCYHLFCNECIDESIRNRHRKCPACGEKFGQDDVKNIFFTH